MGRVYAFPKDAFYVVDEEHGFVRRGRGPTPLAVCRPPHVVVSGTINSNASEASVHDIALRGGATLLYTFPVPAPPPGQPGP